jgi:hypothetical protein
VNPQKTKREQKAEGRFRAIGSRTQPIQTKDGDTLRRADLLGAFVTGFDRLADDNIKNIHEGSCPMDSLQADVV